MKILIFSDSHGIPSMMQRIIEEQQNRIDLCIHLGDGTREFNLLSGKYPDIPFVYVHGNYEDAYASGPDAETVLDLDGHRIFLTHGHKYGVKGSRSTLIYRALEKECDIVLYGHTHEREDRYIPFEDRDGGIHIFNPGSISRPYFGDSASCGILEIVKSGFIFSHIKL